MRPAYGRADQGGWAVLRWTPLCGGGRSLRAIVELARKPKLMSAEHFTGDGTLIESVGLGQELGAEPGALRATCSLAPRRGLAPG